MRAGWPATRRWAIINAERDLDGAREARDQAREQLTRLGRKDR
jgi:hypothetical protein